MPELVPPAWEWTPEYDKTLGPEVGELATLAGFPPDPEQQLILDALFAFGPTGRALARDVGACAPRQNLKTGLCKQAALGWLYILELPLTVWSAHEFSTAQESFRDMKMLIESCPDLDREVKQVHNANGDEAIELTGNRRLRFKARTKAGGRGLTGDRIILDEAMYLQPAHTGALTPTLRAVPDPQVLLAGSAGMEDSAEWRRFRDRGRAGGDPSLAWFEWGDKNPGGCVSDECPHLYGVEGCALDDRERWRATNSALGRRISEESLAADRRSLEWREFARETLGWWDEPAATALPAFDLDTWASLATSEAPVTGGRVFGVAVAPDRTWSAVSVAHRRADGLPQVELVKYAPGTSWVTAFVADLLGRHGGSVVADTPARGLVPDADEPSSGDQARAHVAFGDAVEAGNLRHLNEPALNVAVKAARWRPLGDSRVLDRKGTTDISPLIAAALALHGLSTSSTTGGWVLSL